VENTTFGIVFIGSAKALVSSGQYAAIPR